jgi:glycosyltransferase involved in cell wall biosynthesis
MMDIAVVIAARDPGELLRETLESVAAQSRPAAVTVVVDDGSRDDSVAAMVSAFAGVVLVRTPPEGRAPARNRGAAATDSDALLFLDADDLLRPGALDALAGVLEADSSLDMVHGQVFEFVDRRYPPLQGCASVMPSCECDLAERA